MSLTMPERIHRSPARNPELFVLVAAFVALALIYSVATPIFEAGDEIWHYPFVQHLATGHGLPIQDPNVETLWEQEGGQPPLYYAVSALATFWIDTRDLSDRLWNNPEAKIGIPLVWGNKNMIVHTSAEDFPWHNTALAVHLIRFLSVLFSAGTVALTYLMALEIKQDRAVAAIAAALVAFNPMFIFISASVNNDSLAVLLASLSLLLLTRLITRKATVRQFGILGVVLGLAALTKASNLGLLIIAAGVFGCLALRQLWGLREQTSLPSPPKVAPPLLAAERSRGSPPPPLLNEGTVNAPYLGGEGGREVGSAGLRDIMAGWLLSAALVVAIAGWWYVRNWQLYGDPLAFNVWVAIAGGRRAPATWLTLLDEFQSFRISFWGNFGAVNIIAPEWVYTALDVLTIVAAAGLLIGLVRRALPRLLVLQAFWLMLIVGSLIRWTLLTMASQGRLIFPAISAAAILLAYGLAQFKIPAVRVGSRPIPGSNLHVAGAFGAVFLCAFSILTPFALVAPTYALPSRLSDEESIPNLTRIVFENSAELVGYALPQKTVSPGEDLRLTVYWRALEPIGEDLSVKINLFDADGEIVGRWNAFPGGGLYPTRLWQPGEIIVDTYRVPVEADAHGPGVGRIEVGLFRRVPLGDLTARDPEGRTVTPTIARYKINGVSSVEIQNPVRFNFENQITLAGYSVENSPDRLRVRLYWRARQIINEDYKVFVHLVDRRGEIVAQQDSQPQHDAYPTSFWGVGETVPDDYELTVPADASGECRVVVGLYRSGDGTRLIVEGDGDSIVLATIPVRR